MATERRVVFRQALDKALSQPQTDARRIPSIHQTGSEQVLCRDNSNIDLGYYHCTNQNDTKSDDIEKSNESENV